MNRKEFIKSIIITPFVFNIMKANALSPLFNLEDSQVTMPILFVGHGNPMNAIETNQFTEEFKKTANAIPKPNAIICISAHWETKGTKVTAMPYPKTIHDFGGFPQSLYNVQYPAQGNPELAQNVKDIVSSTEIILDNSWGLDHGTWSVLNNMYPKADIPVIQISLDYTKPAQYHFELAQQLIALRKKGVLIIGSGNIVHNLRMVAWDKINKEEYGYDWALEANSIIKNLILAQDYVSLCKYESLGTAVKNAIPTPEHYLPLLYILGLKNKGENITFFNDKAVAGSLTMTSLLIQ